MKKYKVVFEFMCADADVSDGKWHKDYLDNNGAWMILKRLMKMMKMI